MLPALASTPSSSSLIGKMFLYAVVTGLRKALWNLCLWDQSCPTLHSPRLPLLPDDLKALAPCSKYKLLEKQIRPLNRAWLNHYWISLVEEYHYCDNISYSQANSKIIQVFKGSGGLGVCYFGLTGITKPGTESIVWYIHISKGYIAAVVEDGHC